MSDRIYVQYSWCEEHADNHMVDEQGNCHGECPSDMEAHGYRYIRHVGKGWYSAVPPKPALSLEWEMLLDARTQATAEKEQDW